MAQLTEISFSDDFEAAVDGQADDNCQVCGNTADGNYDGRGDAEATVARLVLCFGIQVVREVLFYQHSRKIKFRNNA